MSKDQDDVKESDFQGSCLLCLELRQPGRFDSLCLSSVVAGLQVLRAGYPAEFPLGAPLVAQDPVLARRASLTRGSEVEAPTLAVVLRPAVARDLECHKNGLL